MARSGSQERTNGASQQAQGRLKEAISALTGNRREARQGRSSPRPAARALGAPQRRSAPDRAQDGPLYLWRNGERSGRARRLRQLARSDPRSVTMRRSKQSRAPTPARPAADVPEAEVRWSARWWLHWWLGRSAPTTAASSRDSSAPAARWASQPVAARPCERQPVRLQMTADLAASKHIRDSRKRGKAGPPAETARAPDGRRCRLARDWR